MALDGVGGQGHPSPVSPPPSNAGKEAVVPIIEKNVWARGSVWRYKTQVRFYKSRDNDGTFQSQSLHTAAYYLQQFKNTLTKRTEDNEYPQGRDRSGSRVSDLKIGHNLCLGHNTLGINSRLRLLSGARCIIFCHDCRTWPSSELEKERIHAKVNHLDDSVYVSLFIVHN